MTLSGLRHGEYSAPMDGARRWIKAVAMMTPEPNYLMTKKTTLGA
jgi:hypothetical protein